MFEKYPLIYCPICHHNQPLRVSVLEADGPNDHEAIDLMCSVCDLVIATLHEKQEGVG